MSSPGKRTVSKKGYKRYINSPEWKDVKRRYADSRLPKECWGCRAPWQRGFHMHHRTYKNLGVERLMDIVPVCPACHDSIHLMVEKCRMSIWDATGRVHRYGKGKASPELARQNIERVTAMVIAEKAPAAERLNKRIAEAKAKSRPS